MRKNVGAISRNDVAFDQEKAESCRDEDSDQRLAGTSSRVEHRKYENKLRICEENSEGDRQLEFVSCGRFSANKDATPCTHLYSVVHNCPDRRHSRISMLVELERASICDPRAFRLYRYDMLLLDSVGCHYSDVASQDKMSRKWEKIS